MLLYTYTLCLVYPVCKIDFSDSDCAWSYNEMPVTNLEETVGGIVSQCQKHFFLEDWPETRGTSETTIISKTKLKR